MAFWKFLRSVGWRQALDQTSYIIASAWLVFVLIGIFLISGGGLILLSTFSPPEYLAVLELSLFSLAGLGGAMWFFYAMKLFVARVHAMGHAARWFMLGALIYSIINMYRYEVYALGTLPVWLFGIELMCLALYITASIYYMFFSSVSQTKYPPAVTWPDNPDILVHKLACGALYGLMLWIVWLAFEDLSMALNNRSILPLPEPLTAFTQQFVEAEAALFIDHITSDVLPPELAQ
jgi:hypothetical protein